MIRKFVGAALLALCFEAASAAVLDFEEFDPPVGGSIVVRQASIQSRGFEFTPAPATIPVNTAILITDDAQPSVPNSGSNVLLAEAQSGGFTMTAIDGSRFDLISFLAAEGRNTTSSFFRFSATGILLQGTQASGSTVSLTLDLDLIATESIGDFELFAPVGFTSLTMLTLTGFGGIDGNSFAIDDLNLGPMSAIPLPPALWLFATAVLGLAGLSRSKRRR